MSREQKQPVKRLALREMEEWKAKAKALDEAVEWLRGRIGSAELFTINAILTGWAKGEATEG